MESEQFSLCWNNFHNNLSSGFNSLLQDEDLVDVTLAAEGKYLKAHKAVLSVCSSYFKELFRVNPCKHPIVILQGVNYEALKNLLQFMYQGEVSVTQDEIPTFMKVAETLKVKGLTENATAEKNRVERNNHNSSCTPAETKPHMMGRRTVKKLIKPIQHLRPLEEPIVLHSSPSSLQPPPAKKPNLGNASPVTVNTDLPEQQHSVETKEEPVDISDDNAMENRYEEQTDVKPVINTRLQEPSSSQVTGNWTSDVKADQCSPGDIKTEVDYEDENPNLVFYSYSESLQSVENKRWSVADTFALIAAYNKYRNQFVFAKRRKEVWELITEFLKSNGINYSCQNVQDKWKNLVRAYKGAKENIMRFGKAPNRFPFFDKMHETLNSEEASIEIQIY